MVKPLIIFDVDGTLLDSLDVIIECANQVAEEVGLDHRIDENMLHHNTSIGIYRQLKIRWWQIPKLLRHGLAKYKENAHRTKKHPGIVKFLKHLQKHADLAIVSTNNDEMIDLLLETHNLQDFFAFRTGGVFFGKHTKINKARKHFATPRSLTMYVGDETRDIIAADKAGVSSLAVTWGMQSPEVLITAQPNLMASDLEEAKLLLDAWMQA